MQTSKDTMQAAVLDGHGGPERIRVQDHYPRPQPAAGEVLIRVGAASINNTDIWSREGAYSADPSAPAGWRGVPLDCPRIQGGDVAGRIVATGAAVPETRVGERVLVNALLYGDEGDGLVDAGLLGSERDGGFAEYVTVPAENANPVDTTLSDAELATFPIAYLTALHMLNRAGLTADETVLVTGSSGGVGTALVELAVARGARVIALTSRDKIDYAASLGASACIDRRDPALAAKLQEITGAGARVAADVVGGELFGVLLDALAPGGRYVTGGAMAGSRVTLDLRTLYLRHLEMIGSTMGTRDEFGELVGLIEGDMLKPRLASARPLSRIHQAQREFVEKAFTGKLVLIPDALWSNNND